LSRLSKSEKEENALVEKIEASCTKFDHRGKGYLSVDEIFNVVKLQNGVDVSKDEIKRILAPIPRDKEGKIKIKDFISLDIHSEDAFDAMDKNKDGFITKGELKPAKKNIGMKEINECIKEFDIDKDGKLNLDEFRKSSMSGK
jgi:Ca2+-binding EF-hand superfamily protein